MRMVITTGHYPHHDADMLLWAGGDDDGADDG